MPIEITMPRLSDTMEEGTLVKWRVRVGDVVASGDLLADIETDKATMELQNYDDGTVAQLAVKEGEVLPVGGRIAILAEAGETIEDAVSASEVGGTSPPAPVAPVATASTETTSTPRTEEIVPEPQPSESARRLRVSPVARKMADEFALDLRTITGTGPEGRIIKRDVLAARDGTAATPSPAAAAAEQTALPQRAATSGSTKIALSGMRKTIAQRLAKSKATIPHFTVNSTVRMDPLLQLRSTINEQLAEQATSQDRLSVNDFLARGTALALVEHLALNASWADDSIEQYTTVNLGVAVSLPPPPEGSGGLVVATLRDAQTKSVRQIGQQIKSLVQKARTGGLSVDEMSDGTFTITNLGMFGVDHFEAIINPPQAGILAFGAAQQKPVVQGGQIEPGHEMSCTLSVDHRVVDGAIAAQFLQTLKNLLEHPAVLLL